jgi:hypothetical protein
MAYIYVDTKRFIIYVVTYLRRYDIKTGTRPTNCFTCRVFVSMDCSNNIFQGNGSTQNLLCVKSSQCSNESNSPTSGNTQKSICVRSGNCQNNGVDTKVISIKSSSCKNDDASGSTTICVNNRIINRPSS